MFRTVLLSTALDHRDQSVQDGLVTLVGPLGIKRIVLVHVHPRPAYASSILGDELLEVATVAAPRGLAGEVEDLQARLPAVDIEGYHCSGVPYQEVALAAERTHADLIAIGRLHSDGSPAWGDRGMDIVRYAQRPVLVVPMGSAVSLDRIVVGVDFSNNSHDALKAACTIGTGEVVGCFSFHVDPAISHGGFSPAEFRRHITENAARHFREEILPQIPAGARQPRLVTVEADEPEQALLDTSRDAGLLVVGARGLSPLAARLVGSTTERLSALSNVPVLSVRRPGEDLGVLSALLHRK